jgi:hypothetical protein
MVIEISFVRVAGFCLVTLTMPHKEISFNCLLQKIGFWTTVIFDDERLSQKDTYIIQKIEDNLSDEWEFYVFLNLQTDMTFIATYPEFGIFLILGYHDKSEEFIQGFCKYIDVDDLSKMLVDFLYKKLQKIASNQYIKMNFSVSSCLLFSSHQIDFLPEELIEKSIVINVNNDSDDKFEIEEFLLNQSSGNDSIELSDDSLKILTSLVPEVHDLLIKQNILDRTVNTNKKIDSDKDEIITHLISLGYSVEQVLDQGIYLCEHNNNQFNIGIAVLPKEDNGIQLIIQNFGSPFDRELIKKNIDEVLRVVNTINRDYMLFPIVVDKNNDISIQITLFLYDKHSFYTFMSGFIEISQILYDKISLIIASSDQS